MKFLTFVLYALLWIFIGIPLVLAMLALTGILIILTLGLVV